MAVRPVVSVAGAPRVRRKLRKPKHQFQLRHEAFQIQPFLIAPVLPNETLKQLLLQARVVTDPLANPLVGWWIEHYVFYVKHRDLTQASDDAAGISVAQELQQMVLDPTWTNADVDDAGGANVQYYFAGGGINWTKLCLQRVVETFFRNEGEAWDDYTLGGMPIASIQGNSFLDSVTLAADWDAADVNVTLLDTDTVSGADAVSIADIQQAMTLYEFAKLNGGQIADMSYEQFLASYGVRMPREQLNVPELIRYSRQWTYPTNTVDPTSGTPTSACSWAVAERADKDRFFKEPGFIFGVTVARPKTYLGNLTGSAVQYMDNGRAWLPGFLSMDPMVSWMQGGNGDGPLGTLADADGYYVDIRDLLVYGDQFVNFDMTAVTDENALALPTAANEKRYGVEADIDDLFFSGDGTDNLIKQDGIVDLEILGAQSDQTPTVNRGNAPT